MTDDSTHLLTTTTDVFWAIMDLLDPTSLAFCSQVSKRWHTLVRARPDASHRMKPAYQVERLLLTPTLLKWGWKHAPLGVRKRFCKTAAARGDLQSLQWLRIERAAPWDESVCAAAALGGHLATLQWARKTGAPWSAAVLRNAAKGGHFATFRWARRAKAPWDGKVLRIAAKHGSFRIFRWCFCHRAPSMDTAERFAGYFAAAGCLEAVRWMYEKDLIEENRGTFADILVSAAAGGHPQILRWALSKNLATLDEDTVNMLYAAAAVNGRLVFLQWLQRHGCPPNQYVCEQAAAGGHLECLRWAVAQEGITLSPGVYVCAARSGDLPLLQWVRAQGAPWTTNVYPAAIDSGNVELIQWVLDQAPSEANVGFLLDFGDQWRVEALDAACCETACVEAARNGKLAILEWAAAHGAKITTRRAGVLAAKGGHLGVVKWLHARGDPLAWDSVVEYAAEEGHLSVVQWAVANGAPLDKICGAAMSGTGRFEVLRWAVDEASADHSGADHPMFYVSPKTLAWAHTHGFRLDPNRAYLEAARSDDEEMLRWALRAFGPPGDGLYALALETRAVDSLDRLDKYGIEWTPATRCVLPQMLQWMRAVGSPWGDGGALTDGATSSQSDEEGGGENRKHRRPTQDYYESLSSGCEESDGGPSDGGPSDGEASGPSDGDARSPGRLRTELIKRLMTSNFTGLSGFSDGSVLAFLDGGINAVYETWPSKTTEAVETAEAAEMVEAAEVAESAEAAGSAETAEAAEAAGDVQQNVWPDPGSQ